MPVALRSSLDAQGRVTSVTHLVLLHLRCRTASSISLFTYTGLCLISAHTSANGWTGFKEALTFILHISQPYNISKIALQPMKLFLWCNHEILSERWELIGAPGGAINLRQVRIGYLNCSNSLNSFRIVLQNIFHSPEGADQLPFISNLENLFLASLIQIFLLTVYLWSRLWTHSILFQARMTSSKITPIVFGSCV